MATTESHKSFPLLLRSSLSHLIISVTRCKSDTQNILDGGSDVLCTFVQEAKGALYDDRLDEQGSPEARPGTNSKISGRGLSNNTRGDLHRAQTELDKLRRECSALHRQLRQADNQPSSADSYRSRDSPTEASSSFLRQQLRKVRLPIGQAPASP